MSGHFRSHLLRSELIAGPAAIEALSSHPLLTNNRRPLLLSGNVVGASPFFAAVVRALPRYADHPVIVRDLPSPAIDSVVETLAARQPASTLDAAKAIALLIARGGKVEDHAHTRAGPPRATTPGSGVSIPIVAIPTTLSGSEANANASIRNSTMTARFSLVDPDLRPRLVVMDPAALASHRIGILFGSAFNALAHCIEGIYSTRRHALADAQAHTAARLLCSVLDLPDRIREPDALTHLQIASLMAGGLISEVYVGLHHAICHALVSCCGVSHAEANGTVLPWAVEFNLRGIPVDSDRRRAIASALDVTEIASALETTTAIRARLDRMQHAAGLPRRLSELGVARRDLARIVDYALQDRALNTNPISVERPQLAALLDRAF